MPAGANGPALMLYHNFGVIRRYNNSDRYALVVALLARAFDGRSGLVSDWPRAAGSLNREQILELQTLLNGLGYNSGTPDGLFGSGTRGAVRNYQSAQSLPADGFPTAALLTRVRASAGITQPEPARVPHGLQRNGIRELQRLLNRQGYNAGRADGVIGARTRDAIRAFERAQGMEVRGRATDVVLERAREARAPLGRRWINRRRRSHNIAQPPAHNRERRHKGQHSGDDRQRRVHAEVLVHNAADQRRKDKARAVHRNNEPGCGALLMRLHRN
ncbi:MAG: peptidoglycan-binding protein [Caulobacteraceae bacterium]|nr:peptidoglycan-binding protein [Caulobacteraceae bacterium]